MTLKSITKLGQWQLGLVLGLVGIALVLTKTSWAPSLSDLMGAIPVSASVRSALFGIVSEIGMFLAMLGIFLFLRARRGGSPGA
jgi:hypothetical protein